MSKRCIFEKSMLSRICFDDCLFMLTELFFVVYLSNLVCGCGLQSNIVIEPPKNISTLVGHNVYFLCCGGIKWTYESDTGFTGREIGPHPVSSAEDELKKNVFAYDLPPKYTKNSKHIVEKTVYAMRDDRGRLVLRVDNASLRDSGVYRCHGKKDFMDASLGVYTTEHFSIGHSDGLPILPLAAGMIKHFKMFPSDRSEDVVLQCPLTFAQTVIAWEWREPIPPDSEIADSLPVNAIPSRTVSHNKPGIFSNGNVQIGPGLGWAKILDPMSPEAPTKLWCKFKMDHFGQGETKHPSYHEIDWALYEPINVQLQMLNSSEKDFYEHLGSPEASIDYSALYGSLGMEKEQSSLQDRMKLRQQQPRLIEGYPAKLACVFRAVQSSVGGTLRPPQVASWLRGLRPLPQPPFHVNNSQVTTEGTSVMSVRAYPVSATAAASSGDRDLAQIPYENITCVVSSRINEEYNYTVTSNASLRLEVIRQPRIVDISLMSKECSLGDYVQLVCLALANGKPNVSIEFSSTTSQPQGDANGDLQTWRPPSESYTLRIYRSEPESEKPMLNRLVVDIRGAERAHHGAYRCRVTNAAGQAQFVGALRVRSEPRLVIQPLQSTYFIGRRPLVISCLVTGYPLAVQDQTTLSPGVVTTSSGGTISPANRNSGLSDETEQNSPVTLTILNPDMQVEPLGSVKLTSLRMGIYEGINATYSVIISHHPLQRAIARCHYVHTDRTMISDEVHIKEAAAPASPKIVALCAGPGAVIFGVSNPPVLPENEPTDKIVSQRVLFAPSAEFHSASNLASKAIILDIEGQPRSETVDGDEETVQEALENAPSRPRSDGRDPPLVTVPLTNLLPDTNYTFEWSSANQFSLTSTTQFTTRTAPLGPPLKPASLIFLMPTSQHLRIAVFLDDPCPYDNGGRAELGNIIIRYRKAVRQSQQPNSPSVGIGNWSEGSACVQGRPKGHTNSLEAAIGPEVGRFLWSGDQAIQCDLKVDDTTAEYEIAVATTNRFGMSPWQPAIYRAAEAMRSAYLYSSASLISQLSFLFLLPILSLVNYRF